MSIEFVGSRMAIINDVMIPAEVYCQDDPMVEPSDVAYFGYHAIDFEAKFEDGSSLWVGQGCKTWRPTCSDDWDVRIHAIFDPTAAWPEVFSQRDAYTYSSWDEFLDMWGHKFSNKEVK